MIIKTDQDTLLSYLEDSSGLLGGFCQKVFLPESEKEMREILKQASSEKTPVTISGAGTGVAAGRIPFGGAVISTEKLNRILEIDPEKKSAILEPGVRIEDLQKEAKKFDLVYPVDATETTAYIGGNIATNASGSRCFRYGPTRKFVQRLKAILANGEHLEIERGKIFAQGRKISVAGREIILPNYQMPKIKNAAGYFIEENMDFIDLFIGQEGTLAVISEVEVGLIKRWQGIFAFLAFFPKKEEALSFVLEARKESYLNRKQKRQGINALAMEYFDFYALELLRQKYPQIPQNVQACVYIEQDFSQAEESAVSAAWVKLLEKFGVDLANTWAGESEKEVEKFKEFRHVLPEMVNEIVKKNKMPKVGTDLAVPDDKLPDLIRFYAAKLKETKIAYVLFGHIGENHLHLNMLPKDEAEFRKAKAIYLEFSRFAVSSGGTVSAEHGIGKIKHPYLEAMYGKQAIQEMGQLKKSLDPACILGLDNIFPKESLFLPN
jgi:D-lactate dehydrogenase (cytochrome)